MIELYSLATPNGQKIGIALEEMELKYTPYTINILNGDQFKEEFIRINPNSKIPAIVDTKGDKGHSFPVFESGAILLYLAEKTGLFLPSDPVEKSKVMQWLFFQVGGIGPMFGQFGHFTVYAKDERDLSYSVERYEKEVRRLLKVLDNQLHNNIYIAGEKISIADFSIYPWIKCLETYYKAKERLELESYKFLYNWYSKLGERPKLQKGLTVCDL